MSIDKKVILTDVDGVCLDWTLVFENWMQERGLPVLTTDVYNLGTRHEIDSDQARSLVIEFNSSIHGRSLPPYKDVLENFKLLNSHGYKFIAVTCFGEDHLPTSNRIHNLQTVFGKDMFLDIHSLPIGSSKFDCLAALAQTYHGTYWIDDHVPYAVCGAAIGYKTFLMDHSHNTDAELLHDIERIQGWGEITRRLIP